MLDTTTATQIITDKLTRNGDAIHIVALRRAQGGEIKPVYKALRKEIKADQPADQPAYTLTLPDWFKDELAETISEFVTAEERNPQYGIFKDSFNDQPAEWLTAAMNEFFA